MNQVQTKPLIDKSMTISSAQQNSSSQTSNTNTSKSDSSVKGNASLNSSQISCKPATLFKKKSSVDSTDALSDDQNSETNSQETEISSNNSESEASQDEEQAPEVSDENEETKDNSGTSETKSAQNLLDEALDFCQAAQDYWQKGELDQALEALDHAYSLVINVDGTDSPKIIQQKDDLRYLISKRILEIYASRHIVVSGNHKEIPIVINKYVQKEIDLFTKGNEKNFFEEAYKRSGKYRPYIVQALKEAGLPEELSWLPLIESGYKVRALSKARALGLWQFIPSTGYKFGLKRDKYIDERLDPMKSTTAAISYMNELHDIFGDWSTVLAAYNCGEGKVLRIIRDQNINYLDNFWDLYERLPFETARYVPRFLATLHIVNNLEKYGLSDMDQNEPYCFETMNIEKQVHLKDVADILDIDPKVLFDLNPELRYKILPSESYELRLPAGASELLAASIDKIQEHKPPQQSLAYHRVRRGETLSTIAAKYKISVKSIVTANRINKKNYIVPGQVLKIPGVSTTESYTAARKTTQGTRKIPTSHKVKPGDSLWIIANRYGTTTKKLQELNHLKSTYLSIGQVLLLPGSADEDDNSKQLTESVKIKVKQGDSPYRIATRHNMSLERFLRINRLTPSSKIYPGQVLYVE